VQKTENGQPHRGVQSVSKSEVHDMPCGVLHRERAVLRLSQAQRLLLRRTTDSGARHPARPL